MKRFFLVGGALFFLMLLTGTDGWCENVKLKIGVTNPSATETTTVPVRSYFPRGVKAEDVVDAGGLEIRYDFDKSLYYAAGEVELPAGEKRDFTLLIKDVWQVPAEEIGTLREHTKKLLALLQKSDYSKNAGLIAQSISVRLDKIAAIQADPDRPVSRKISEHEASLALLRETKKDIGVLEDLALQNDASGEGIGQLYGEATPTNETLRVHEAPADLESTATVKFRMEASNREDKEAAVPVRFYLPEEVQSDHVVDKGGLDLSYDNQRGVYRLEKKDLRLLPKEKREFTVEVKDVWLIPQSRLDVLKAHTEKILKALSSSPFRDAVDLIGEDIMKALEDIAKSQTNRTVSVERHIGDYRLNVEKFEEARRNVAKLERLLIQAGGSVDLTASGSLVPGAGRSRKSEGRTVLFEGTEGMALVGKSMLRGKAPSPATSWKIIWGIIAFLGLIGSMFFMLWWAQVKKSEKAKMEKIG